MKYQTYPAYKDSDVEWLGEVPEHWTNGPIKYMALEECSLFLDGDWIESKDLSDEGIRYITTGNIGEGIYKEQGAGYITEDKFETLNCTEVFEGDILISRLNLPIGRSCIVPNLESRIITSVDNVIFRPDSRYSKNYLVYLFSSEGYFKHTGNVARGTTMQRISRGLLGNIRVIVPPLTEQQKIAQFLDHETAKIDTLIEKQQRLIELLKEKRQAVISHAVTKGLNPNAPMKESGVEWLGNVPEGWEVGCLKRFADIIDCKHFTVKFIDDGLPIVSIREVRDDKIDLSNANMTSENEWHFLREGRVPKLGDLIFCRNASVGAVGYVDFDTPFCMGQDVCLIRPEIASRYIHYQLTSVLIRNQIEAFLIGATIRRANVEEIRNLFVIYPPEDEQHLITDFLNRKTAKMDALILKAQNAIELMQERRTALISAAVTGKIDVRDCGD
jgi:type I restriction enzyme S subunit